MKKKKEKDKEEREREIKKLIYVSKGRGHFCKITS